MTAETAAVGPEPDELTCDLVVVGAGPVGLYATYYAGFRELSVVVIDSLEQPGGQMATLYPEKLVYDVAGFPAVRAQTLVDALVEQADSAAPTYLLGHVAQTLVESGDLVTVVTDRGTSVRARAVLVAAGIGKFTPRALPTGDEFHGRGLRYFVPRLDDLAGEDVVVIGGGDSAVDWALSLEPVAASVTLVHRRDEFRAHERSVSRLHASSVVVRTPCEVEAIDGEDRVSTVTIRDLTTDTSTPVPAGSVVAALGFKATLGPLKSWGLAAHERDIAVDRSMRTTMRRVFAAGDVAGHPDKVKLISVGFAEAATAVNHIAASISSVPVSPGHSSDGA
ncbi:MAG: NAD(P)/FAD-dependent oxidoreductase [Gordonia paraffinivorans]